MTKMELAYQKWCGETPRHKYDAVYNQGLAAFAAGWQARKLAEYSLAYKGK